MLLLKICGSMLFFPLLLNITQIFLCEYTSIDEYGIRTGGKHCKALFGVAMDITQVCPPYRSCPSYSRHRVLAVGACSVSAAFKSIHNTTTNPPTPFRALI